MALNLDCNILSQVVEKAAHDAADHERWLTAIGRAILELDSNPYLARNDHGGLIIGSPSGNVYAANGVCQCEAYQHGKKPCWHRAAARLVRLHDEREAAAAQLADKVIEVVDQSRVARKIAAARATAQLNELFA
jgi:hypothetical protein